MVKKVKPRKELLTDPKIRAYPYALKGHYHVYDTRYPGLYVRVGKRTKVFYFMRGGDKIKIAKFEELIHLNGAIYLAHQAARALIDESASPASSTVPMMEFGDYLDKLYELERKGLRRPLRPQTIKSIKSFYSDWLNIRINRINSDLLSKKISLWESSYLLESGKFSIPNTQATIRKKIILINAVFNNLVRKSHISKNPFDSMGFKIPAVKPDIKIYNDDIKYGDVLDFVLSEYRPSGEDASKYRKNHSRAARVYIAVVIRLGLRGNEALSNKSKNFIIGKDSKGRDQLRLIIPSNISKTGKGRDIYIACPVIVSAIRDFKDNHHVPNDNDFMFFNPSTRSVYTNNLGRSLYKELKDNFGLGVDGNGSGKMYGFRHTFATRTYRATGNIKLVADLIGDSVETASKYYVASDTEAASAAISSLE